VLLCLRGGFCSSDDARSGRLRAMTAILDTPATMDEIFSTQLLA
jgi:hypothetical protein